MSSPRTPATRHVQRRHPLPLTLLDYAYIVNGGVFIGALIINSHWLFSVASICLLAIAIIELATGRHYPTHRA